MTSHHWVEFDEFSLTRLPIGRAEGRLYVLFTRSGRQLGADESPDLAAWPLAGHVTFESGGRLLEHLSHTGGGDDALKTHLVEFTDSGETSMTITYVEADEILSAELVDLPER